MSKLFSPYIERYRNEYDASDLTPTERATRIITEFLEKNNSDKTFNKKQRIILIAADFDEQTLSACAWLVHNHVDISCLQIQPMKVENQLFLHVNRLLPVQKLDDYFVEVADTGKSLAKVDGELKINRTYLPRMDKLFEWGIIQQGDILSIKGYKDSEATAINPKNIEYKGQKLSYNQWGQRVTGWSSICIYQWAISQRHGELLDTLRKERLLQDMNENEGAKGEP